MRKAHHKDLWERIFSYPSFNIRFGYTLSIVLACFCIAMIIFFKLKTVNDLSEQIAVFNLFIQLATFILGIFAAYYALRQLVETRFTKLDEAGMQELKNSHYSRAFEKWKEAFYIRPDALVFLNMCESLLLLEEYDTFDQYIKLSRRKGHLKKQLSEETSYEIIILYLRAIRNLMVKNQGEAEKHLTNLISIVRSKSLMGFHWDFIDLLRSGAYQNLGGECKIYAENLIDYLSKKMPPNRQDDFESGNFASKIDESTQELSSQQTPTA